MWPNPQETADLVTFTDEILNWKLHFLCSVRITMGLLEKIFNDVKMEVVNYGFESK